MIIPIIGTAVTLIIGILTFGTKILTTLAAILIKISCTLVSLSVKTIVLVVGFVGSIISLYIKCKIASKIAKEIKEQ